MLRNDGRVIVAVDLETTSLNPRDGKILSWAAAWETGATEYGMWTDQKAVMRLKEILFDPKNVIVGHNIKFDISFLETQYGTFPPSVTFQDTLHLAWLLNENEERFSLEYLAERYCGIKLKGFDEYGEQKDLFTPILFIEEKCKQDVLATVELYRNLRTRLHRFPSIEKVYENLYSPLISVIVEMERVGILIDLPRIDRLKRRYKKAWEAAQKRLDKLIGYHIDAERNIEISRWLFGEYGLKPTANMRNRANIYRMKERPLWCVNKDVLSEYGNDPACRTILKCREYGKLYTTYAYAWFDNANRNGGRIYTHFIQCRSPKFAKKDDEGGTATGRWASADPVNMQTVPRKAGLKACIIPPVGWKAIYADYGQLELRIMAHVSGDQELVKAFNNGLDLHQMTMDALGIKNRTVAKNCNFGLLYLIGAYKFQRQLFVKAGIVADIPTVEQWMVKWYRMYSGVPIYQEKVARQLKCTYEVETLLKRKRRFDKNRLVWDFESCHRQAVNATVQGSAADIIGVAMLNFIKARDQRTSFFLQVHDSIGLVAHESVAESEAKRLKECMEGAVKLRVPLIANVGVGNNLFEAEKNAH